MKVDFKNRYMKKLIVVILTAITINGYSQIVNDVKIKDLDIKYCKIVGYNKSLLGQKIVVTVDYGQKYNWIKPQVIKDHNGKALVFNSMIEALNYMDGNGWEYVNNFVVTTGQTNIYHYLLRKK